MSGIVEDPCEWRGPELMDREDWIYRFTGAELAEIEAAFAHARASGKTFDTVTAEDFPLPTVAARLRDVARSLEDRYGLYVLRGIPTEGRAVDDLRFIFWCIGKHLGTAVCQTYNGDYLGDVRDFGKSDGRLYNTNQAGGFHVDNCDVVGLFVVRPARTGGLSQITSTVAIHNEMARTRPDLLEVLYQPFYWKNTVPPPYNAGKPAFFQQPVFTRVGGKLSCFWLVVKIRAAQGLDGVPALTPLQEEALAMVEALAEDERFVLSMMFEPGDMQFVNNHVCVHGRTAFEDFLEEGRKRHLFRLWLAMPNSRPLDPAMAPTYGEVAAGAVRGGIGAEAGLRKYQSYESMS
jgi:hypothetical protein